MDLGIQQIGRALLILGLIITAIGAAMLILGRFFPNKLPGDFTFTTKNTTIYFPLATCIIISLLLTLITWLIRHFSK